MLIDSHCHLCDEAFRPVLGQKLALWAAQGGPGRYLSQSAQPDDWPRQEAIRDAFPDRVQIAIGLHPQWAGLEPCDDARLNALIDRMKVVLLRNPGAWIGEIGLDFAEPRFKAHEALQRKILAAQLDLAEELGRPVMLHARKSAAAVHAMIRRRPKLRGCLHGSSEGAQILKLFLGEGFLIGAGSVLLYEPSPRKFAEAAAQLPDDGYCLETDSPFMSFRGQNEPTRIARIVRIVANLRGQSAQDVEESATRNISRLLSF